MQKLLRHGEKFISFRIYIYQARSMVFLKWGRGGRGRLIQQKKGGWLLYKILIILVRFGGGGAYL